MFELAEYSHLASQMNEILPGKVISEGSLGNSPHKFVWYNRSSDQFDSLTRGKTAGKAYSRAKWLFLPLEPGYVLLFGESGGKILFHTSGSSWPEKYHLSLTFSDGSFLTAMTVMWGGMELYEQGLETQRQGIAGMRPTPVDADFTFEYFNALIDQEIEKGKRSAKGLLTQEALIPGLGNAIAQDILFHARLNPRHPIETLTGNERLALYNAILETVNEVIKLGGRYDEVDLYDRPGGYIRLMDQKTAGKPCPICGTKIEKIQYLGGACYFCPTDQK